MRQVALLFISIIFVLTFQTQLKGQDEKNRYSFKWEGVTLRGAIDSLMKYYSESIVYIDKDVEGIIISVSCAGCNVEEALSNVLYNTDITWIKLGSQIILRKVEKVSDVCLHTIFGNVQDSVTSQAITDAVVYIKELSSQDNKSVLGWSRTNAHGFFSIPKIPDGKYVMVIRAMGYETFEIDIDSLDQSSLQCDIKLIPKEILVQGVTIEGNPAMLATAVGLSKGICYKSAPMDLNQYLLDGAKVYNPIHFGGIWTTINSEVTNDVELSTSGIPPSYGGYIGGIVDLSLRNGSRERVCSQLELGTLSSNLLVEGPITKSTSFIISGRRGYPNIAMGLSLFGRNDVSKVGTEELIGKISYRVTNNNQIMLNAYLGDDNYRNEVEGETELLKNDFNWRNHVLNLRWISVPTSSLFLYLSTAFTGYRFNISHLLNGSSMYNSNSLSSRYSIEDLNFRIHAEGYYDKEHTMKAGVEITRRKVDSDVSEFSTQIVPYVLRNHSSLETAVYFQDEWKLSPKIYAEIGGRTTSYSNEGSIFSSVDPRFSMLIELNEHMHLFGSVATITQFIHPYRNSGVFMLYPIMFWYQSTEKILPTKSTYIRLGIEKSYRNEEYTLSLASYYKYSVNIHEFVTDDFPINKSTLEDLQISGSARAFGITINSRKRFGKLTGTLAYDLSWAFNKFAEVNNGQEFASPFDRRHEFQFGLFYSINNDWQFSALCIYTPSQKNVVIQRSFLINLVGAEPAPPNVGRYSLSYKGFIDINSNQLPGFQRLELSLTRRLSISHFYSYIILRLMNGYGILDPYKWQLVQTSDLKKKWNVVLQKQNLFPLYPVLEIALRM